MKRLGIIFAAIGSVAIVALLAFGAFLVWAMNSHPVSRGKIARLQAGMGAPEVQAILGTPFEVSTNQDGEGFWWTYGNRHQWRYFYVEFSSSSNVIRFAEDD
jgi:hypothetical protein